ncbi:unnamed protein product, partial [Prorocentrum cordatum]
NKLTDMRRALDKHDFQNLDFQNASEDPQSHPNAFDENEDLGALLGAIKVAAQTVLLDAQNGNLSTAVAREIFDAFSDGADKALNREIQRDKTSEANEWKDRAKTSMKRG